MRQEGPLRGTKVLLLWWGKSRVWWVWASSHTYKSHNGVIVGWRSGAIHVVWYLVGFRG